MISSSFCYTVLLFHYNPTNINVFLLNFFHQFPSQSEFKLPDYMPYKLHKYISNGILEILILMDCYIISLELILFKIFCAVHLCDKGA